MSRAKKTKKAKKYSLTHSYRRITELLNHSDKERGIKPNRGGYGEKNPPNEATLSTKEINNER